MTQPGVSVVMALMNGQPYLAEALESLVSQTMPPLEIVVVDGGSTDGSDDVARSFEPVNLVRQESEGIAGAWNEGIAAARGELLTFLDSDDRLLPDAIAKGVALLEQRPEIEMSIGRVRYFLEPGFGHPPGFRPELLEGDHFGALPGGMITRRSVFERAGLFDEGYSIASDVEWYGRLKRLGIPAGNLTDVVMEKRVHDGNLSHSDIAHLHREFLQVFRESIKQHQQGE